MCELLSKVEDLKQVLQRCSKIIEADPTNPSFGDRSDKEIASLTQKVSDLQAKLLTLKKYSKRLEDQINQSKRRHEDDKLEEDIDAVAAIDEEKERVISRKPLHNSTDKDRSVPPTVNFEERMEEVLFLVFRFLTIPQLVQTQRVSKAWNKVSKHPSLWQRVALVDIPLSHKTLYKLAPYCCSTQTLRFQGLIPSPALPDEDLNSYISRQKASLEPALSLVLNECGSTLSHLAILECSLLFTERCFWLISKYCMSLETVTYYSNEFPPTPEALWCLANACTGLKQLHLYPSHDKEVSQRFNDKCLAVIATGFPLLDSLMIGGDGITMAGISKLGVALKSLNCLRIIGGPPLALSGVENYFSAGSFKNLQTLVLDHTRISPQAIVKLIETHPALRRLELTTSIADYFPGKPATASSGNTDANKYDRIMKNLEDLARHFRYGSIFKLSHE